MKHENYLAGVNKTWKKDDKYSELTHCRLAIVEEVGEVFGWYKKHLGYKKPKDEAWKIGIKGELGDLLYYITKTFDIIDANELIESDFELYTEGEDLNIMAHLTEMSRMALQLCEFSDTSFLFENSLDGLFTHLRLLIKHEGFEFEDIAISNLAKLEKRHGKSFNDKATMEEGRDREAEDKALSNE